MKSEEVLEKELEEYETAVMLRDKGVVTMSNAQHKRVLRQIDFLRDVLEK